MALKKCRECGSEVSTKAKACPHCGAVKPVSRNSLLVMVIAVALLVWFIGDKAGDRRSTYSVTPPQPSPKAVAIAKVSLEDWGWRKGGFDNIMVIDGTIKNSSPHNIKDFTLQCSHFSNSGTRIDSNERVIYESVAAGKSIKIKDFNMGFIHTQAVRTDCRITDLVVH